MVTIRITGPESSGKSSLAIKLAAHLDGVFVPEAARSYLSTRDSYDRQDVLQIAKLQHALEEEARERKPDFLIADTGMLVLSIWYKEKYGDANAWIEKQLDKSSYEVTLLCAPDLPWVPDPLRENPDDRDRLFEIYSQELSSRNVDYFVVRGTGEVRFTKVFSYLKEKGHIT